LRKATYPTGGEVTTLMRADGVVMARDRVDEWQRSGAKARGLWDMIDGPMPRRVLGIGDPDIHQVEGRWTMFLGGFSTTFRNRLYRALLRVSDIP
jgi:hypothetical protein